MQREAVEVHRENDDPCGGQTAKYCPEAYEHDPDRQTAHMDQLAATRLAFERSHVLQALPPQHVGIGARLRGIDLNDAHQQPLERNHAEPPVQTSVPLKCLRPEPTFGECHARIPQVPQVSVQHVSHLRRHKIRSRSSVDNFCEFCQTVHNIFSPMDGESRPLENGKVKETRNGDIKCRHGYELIYGNENKP